MPGGGGLGEGELPGRIVAVADVFDALTSERPYKRAWPLEQAADFLRGQRGTHFDPTCVDAFFAAWDEVLAVRSRFSDGPRVEEGASPEEMAARA